MPAKPHGSAAENRRGSLGSGAVAWAFAGVPQRWQNFAPGVSDAPQALHVAPASDAPQLEQNFPVAGLPQDAQVPDESAGAGETGEAMQRKLHDLCPHVIVCDVRRARKFPQRSRRLDASRGSSA
jgi:hypothetical protein